MIPCNANYSVMKVLIVCLLLTGAVLGENHHRELTANLNDYVDNALPNVISFLVESGFDPLALPNILAEFSAKPIIITYHGRLELSQGFFKNIRSLHRSGDLVVRYSDRSFRVTGNFGINDVEFDYNYSAKFMNIGPSGGVKGSLSSANVHFDISLDFDTLSISLNEFYINNVGSIRVRLTGNPVVDWIANLFIRIITAICKDNIIGFVEEKIRDLMQDFVDDLNENIELSKFLLEMRLQGRSNVKVSPAFTRTFARKQVAPPTLYLDLTDQVFM